jgi:hypothetical protein
MIKLIPLILSSSVYSSHSPNELIINVSNSLEYLFKLYAELITALTVATLDVKGDQ